jgi:hypothetical protein
MKKMESIIKISQKVKLKNRKSRIYKEDSHLKKRTISIGKYDLNLLAEYFK